jgi:hypothetical protein
MKKTTLPLALALAGLLVSSASAQVFVGSDNFASGATAKWDYDYRLNSASTGDLAFTNSRLDYSNAATGAGNQHRIWDSDGTASPLVVSASYNTSWVMTMTTTNTVSALTGGEFVTLGLEVFNDNNSFAAVMLGANNSGSFIRTEGTGFTSPANTSLIDNTDVTLRLTWDAGAQSLAAAYSLDGSTFNAVATFLPVSEWNNAGAGNVTSGFNFGVFGNSNLTTSLSVGSVYADNFAVSAIPEPSTYAAFAGLGALGLAFWRRRQARAAATA